ncbi:nuclear transport factor 2 family protein [Longispora sp. K20-0274]|uniref:ester cyclase n=1 Tax=Longispora sp. K20-0274 TaxID=3088255 RepID=UPI003999C969
MGQAREVMDRLTEVLTTTGDLKAIRELFAEDAVAWTPDKGEVRGRDNIIEWWRTMVDPVPDATYESLYKNEVGNTAIDEGYFGGKNTGPITMPDGSSLPATGKTIRIRGADFATVEDGRIVSYRIYFDQLEFLSQLGLLPETPA